MRDGPFYLTTIVNGEMIEHRRPIFDPLLVHRIETKLCWADRLRFLLRGTHEVEIRVDARSDALRAVMPVIDALPDEKPKPCPAQCTTEMDDGLTVDICTRSEGHDDDHHWQPSYGRVMGTEEDQTDGS